MDNTFIRLKSFLEDTNNFEELFRIRYSYMGRS